MTFTSGKISHDPHPWLLDRNEGRASDDWYHHESGVTGTYAPRPEYDNHNPILVDLRVRKRDIFELLQDLDWDNRWRARFTPQQVEHARRVLELLVIRRRND